MSRYRLPLDPPALLGDKLIERMSRLKIDMMRFTDKDGDRNVLCDFEISGHLRPDGENPGDDRTLKALIREFLMGKPPESLDLDDEEEGGDA